MMQVLFWLPTPWAWRGLPVYGFGLMLFLAFVAATGLAGRRGEKIGLPRDKIGDLTLTIFLLGLIGGRIVYMIQYDRPLAEFLMIWQGGIVFYGGAIGGTIGGLWAFHKWIKPFGINVWQLADVLAPSVALGLAIGRVGCLLNGCCFGHVAPPGVPAITFPAMTAPARDRLVFERHWQTLAGFALDEMTVIRVENGSPAASAGLQPGDRITAVGTVTVADEVDLARLFGDWPRGQTGVALTVERGGQALSLPPFVPRTLPLYPTQIYETISMLLLFVLLLSLYPVRAYDGQLIVVLMLGYAAHRFFNEMLRDDTPTYFLGLTLSQEISIGIAAAGLAIAAWRRARSRAASGGR